LEPGGKLLSTGCTSLDKVLGGLPRGEITLVYGEPGTGKTTLALQISSHVAKEGSRVLFIDADNSFYPERLAQIAGENSEASRLIFVSKPTSFPALTHLLTNLGSYVSSGVALVVVDTMSSLYRKAMSEDRNVFLLNRELNLQLAYLTETARIFEPTVLITSQVRSVPQGGDLEPRTEPVATRVLKFWSQRVLRVSSLPVKGLREIHVEKAEAPGLVGAGITLKLGKKGFE
jgi:DNA repair protein RadB